MSRDSAEVPFVKSRASVALDALRGVAALLVTLEHLRYRLFFDFTPEDLRHPALRLLFSLTEMGHAAVITFFVLSGFLVGGSLLRAERNGRWSWRNYLTHRLVRLWIVLLPALLLGALWDLGTTHLAHASTFPAVTARVAETARCLTPGGLVANLFFLQTALTPVFGSNGPLWSLANEFWYYLLFPLFFFALAPRYSWPLRAVLFASGAALLIALPRSIAWYAPLWLMGALLFYAPAARCGRRVRLGATCAFALALPLLVRVSFRRPLMADYLLALVTTATLWVLLSAAHTAANPVSLPTRAARRLAAFSYTLYLVHVPVFTFAGVVLLRGQPWRPTTAHLLTAGLLWGGTLLFAYGVAWFTEFRTEPVRRAVERWQTLPSGLRETLRQLRPAVRQALAGAFR